jgi:hypothetical protein
VDAIADQYRDVLRTEPSQLLRALRAIIEGPCQDPGKGAFVLVLHGFDPVLASNTQPGELGLTPELLVVARALIGAFSGARTASRLLFTSDRPFSVVDETGDVVTSMLSATLESQ